MGGGDLNLKKSWHPSTMRNMEKVWKAEQKNDQEKKKIAELQREILEERAREDMQKYAEDKGVVEKKDSMKLDWMYKGPGGMVNREEYLLGKSVDKTFEQQQQAEKAASSTTARNHVDHECLPPSIFSGGNEQVDMARKLQEDPLYAIKKKEIETRSQILSNPVKLKQLRELIREQKTKKVKKHKKDKKSKKKKRKRKHSSSSDSDCADLDALLLAKYSKLKDKLQKDDIAKLDVDLSDTSDSDSNTKKITKEKHPSHQKRKHHNKSSGDDDDNDDYQNIKKPYGLQMLTSSKSHRHTVPQSRSSSSTKMEPHSQPSISSDRKPEASNRWKKPERKRLTEEEIEQKRLEMMDNVRWRNQEREKNVSRYRKEEREEKKQSKTYSTEFLTKQLSYAASHGTVESRIKANINNIQRSGMAMDKNFARR